MHQVGAAVLLVAAAAVGTADAMYNGTPTGVPTSFDCAVRELAWQYGKQLAPQRGHFKVLCCLLYTVVSRGRCCVALHFQERCVTCSAPHVHDRGSRKEDRRDGALSFCI